MLFGAFRTLSIGIKHDQTRGTEIKISNSSLVVLVVFIIIFVGYAFGIGNSLAAEPDGKTLYVKSCQMCHAVDGKGNAQLAIGMKIDPARINLIDEETAKKTDADLMKVVQSGNGNMKGFKDKLNNKEIAAIVKYVRFLKK